MRWTTWICLIEASSYTRFIIPFGSRGGGADKRWNVLTIGSTGIQNTKRCCREINWCQDKLAHGILDYFMLVLEAFYLSVAVEGIRVMVFFNSGSHVRKWCVMKQGGQETKVSGLYL